MEYIVRKTNRIEHGEEVVSLVRLYREMPKGWRIMSGTLTQPAGYAWIRNSEPLAIMDMKARKYVPNPKFETAFLELDWHKHLSLAEKEEYNKNHPVTIINI